MFQIYNAKLEQENILTIFGDLSNVTQFDIKLYFTLLLHICSTISSTILSLHIFASSGINFAQ